MPKASFGDMLRFLFRKDLAKEAGDRTDGELLKQFAATREDPPFTVLFERHGPMVMAVCKRILGDFHRAEDAFQATFHILARRAGSIRIRESLAPWLYAVAQRVALRARAKLAGQRDRERRYAEMPRTETIDEATWQDLAAVLDEEIGRLPEKYRAPLILCYLESKGRDRVAKELGWPEGTVVRRLERGRELLRQQLIKRGIALSAGAFATVLVDKVAAAPVPTLLAINTIKAATTVISGQAAGGGFLSAQALILAEETSENHAAHHRKAKTILSRNPYLVGLAGRAPWRVGPGIRNFCRAAAGTESKKAQPAPTVTAPAVVAEKKEPANEHAWGPVAGRGGGAVGDDSLPTRFPAIRERAFTRWQNPGGWEYRIHSNLERRNRQNADADKLTIHGGIPCLPAFTPGAQAPWPVPFPKVRADRNSQLKFNSMMLLREKW